MLNFFLFISVERRNSFHIDTRNATFTTKVEYNILLPRILPNRTELVPPEAFVKMFIMSAMLGLTESKEVKQTKKK